MKTKNKFSLLLSVLLMSLFVVFSTGCGKNDDFSNENEIELIVASKQVAVEGQNALVVRRLTVNNGWHKHYDGIVGFAYEAGYEYHLKVKVVNPPLESSKTATYELIKLISKEKKETIFHSVTYGITNKAKAEGKKLTSEEIATIESEIKKSSPFNGVTSLTLESKDFYPGGPFDRNFSYRTNTGKSGNGKIIPDEDVKAFIYSFDFNGNEVKYEYQKNGSPTSPVYLILDLTSKYKADYPNLENAQSGIGIKIKPLL